MTNSFIKYTTTASAILLIVILPWQIILCCGPSLASDEDRFSLFRQGIINDNALNPFAYTEHFLTTQR